MNDISFVELISRYAIEKNIKPKTVKTYMGVVRVFRRYLGYDVYPSMVTREIVLEWRAKVLVSPKNKSGINEVSWNNYVRHLKALYSFGIKHRLIACDESPFESVSVRQPKKLKKTIQPMGIRYAREVMDLCRSYETNYNEPSKLHPVWFWQVVFETFFYTGIRLNQLLHIKAGNVNLKDKLFLASAEGAKNYADMIIPIPDDLYPHLRQLVVSAHSAGFKRNDQLFNVNRFSERHKGTEMDTWQVENFFRRLSTYCGCRITPHRFRHTLATELMLSPERNIHITQKLLSHSDIRTTMEYIHPDIEAMRRILNQRREI